MLSAMLVFWACQSADKEDTPRTNEQILDEVTEVKAIGKVVPADDWSIISSTVAGRIQQIMVQAGDTVVRGQPLLILESGNADLDIAEARTRLISLQAENSTTNQELLKAQILANELKQIYDTSQQLLERGAETREKTETDFSNWQQQEQAVKSLELQINAQRASEREQRIRIEKAENLRTDFYLTALADGIVTDLDVKVGQHVGGTEELGRIADTLHPIVEAEVDELFADDIRVGQPVFIMAAGRSDTLARGQVGYASPVLSDKSILYETANEGEDRRVRRIKIIPEETTSLIINAKVACTINIR